MRLKANHKEDCRMLVETLSSYMSDNVVIVNIGTDRAIGDAVAPIVGSILKQRNFPLPVYGTMHEPIHALNMEKSYDKIKSEYPNAFIIGIDAALGDIEDIGAINIRNKPVSPGKGVGRTLPEVGDISIVAIVLDSDSNELFTHRSVRLSFIFDLSMKIAQILEEAYELSKTNQGTKTQVACSIDNML